MPTTKEAPQAVGRPKRLYRSEKDRVIAGVCGGLGQYFNVDPTIFRIIFVLFTLAGGSGILAYLLLWIVIPAESAVRGTPEEHVKQGVAEMKTKAEELAGKIGEDKSRNIWGAILIIGGLLLILGNFGIISAMHFARWWPLILVALGLVILAKR